MPSWLPSVSYPAPGEGYWNPVTSTLNWCEEDYYATVYAAELVNSLTNFLYFYLGLKGIVNCLRNGHNKVFVVAFIGYLIVGTGSFLFHTTLKYPMQLVDELSMIYTTCIMIFATFSFRQPLAYTVPLGIFLFGLAVFITCYYHYLKDPAFHQNAYAILTTVVLCRSMFMMEVGLRPSRRRQAGTLQGRSPEIKRRDRRDKKILRDMWLLIGCGTAFFLGGFTIWSLDNKYCSTLRRWRHQIGLPWGILLEGHGWWHLMTGVGAYLFIVWGIWLRHALSGKQDEFELCWPRWIGSMPFIERKSHGTANGIPGKQIGVPNGVKRSLVKAD